MATVKLGDVEYEVPKMNIGQIEDVSALDVPANKWAFAALKILMRRATPKIKDVRDLECDMSEIGEAVVSVMRASGYKLPDPNAAAPEMSPGQHES